MAIVAVTYLWRSKNSSDKQIAHFYTVDLPAAVKEKSEEWRKVLEAQKLDCQTMITLSTSSQERIIQMIQAQIAERDVQQENQQVIMAKIVETLNGMDAKLTKIMPKT